MKKWLIFLLICGLAGGAVWLQFFTSTEGQESLAEVTVSRGDIVRRATAVGRIEVEHVIPVNSRNGGILTRLFVTLGQPVKAGDPLAEVRPLPTTLSLLQAERALELAREAEKSAQEYVDGEHLASLATRLFTGEKSIERMHKSAVLNRRHAEENLKLLKEGKAVVDNRELDYTIRAPVDGHVIAIRNREGAPVTPASMYGTGTELMALADLDDMLFRGTVNEIDVGRLKVGMPVKIKVGALPGQAFQGKLTEIALTSEYRNNAVLFPVRIALEKPADAEVMLRSGFSAVAEIEVVRREQVLSLPERVVDFRRGKAFVSVPGGDGRRLEREVKVGLSDGMTVEILSGVSEGDTVMERTYE